MKELTYFLQDGFILACILACPSVTVSNLSAALRAYDEVRRPRAQEVHRRSQDQGLLYHLRREGWIGISAEQSTAGMYPSELPAMLADKATANMDWTRTTSIEVDQARAVEMVERL